MDIFIRPMRPEDVAEVLPLLRQLTVNVRDATPEDIREGLYQDPNWRPYVAIGLDNQRIITYGELHCFYTAARGWRGHLEYIVTDKPFRNQGVGQRLCEELIRVAKKLGVRILELHTSRADGLGLYKKLGFVSKEKSQVMFLQLDGA